MHGGWRPRASKNKIIIEVTGTGDPERVVIVHYINNNVTEDWYILIARGVASAVRVQSY